VQFGGNLLLLFVFGPAVEPIRRQRFSDLLPVLWGRQRGARAGLEPFLAVPPLLGATGAALGVGLAFAVAEPEAKAVLYP
jgi:hypothetical protein